MMERLREWVCENGHVLGMAGRDGRGVSVLLLYREAVSDGNGVGEVMAVVEGATDVRCSICGRTRSWFMDGKLVKRLALALRE